MCHEEVYIDLYNVTLHGINARGKYILFHLASKSVQVLHAPLIVIVGMAGCTV